MKPERHPVGMWAGGIAFARASCGCCYEVTGRVASRALSRAGFVQRPCPVTGRHGVNRAKLRAALEAGTTFGDE